MDIQIPQIIFQIINFSVVLGALTYLLYKPILKVLDERAQRVEEGQKAAQAAMAEQSNIEELKRQVKQQAEKQAAKMLEEANKAAAARKADLLATAKEEAEALVSKYGSDWQAEKKQLMTNLQAQFTEAVMLTAEKVVGSSLDAKAHSKLIDDELKALIKSI